jgi:nicotinate phosphoribosyltransferase
MAHSFIQAHDREEDAFLRFAEANPESVVLLIDTFDTEEGARKVVALAERLREGGITIRGVRLDSGDMAELAKRVRRILDKGGLEHVSIFASGGLDEEKLAALLAAGGPIDGFGVGSRLDCSADAPYFDCAYKLVEYDGQPRLKESEGKSTLPGRKQVYRVIENDIAVKDVMTLADSETAGEPLMTAVMVDGRRTDPAEGLEALRQRLSQSLVQLPPRWRRLDPAEAFPVEIAEPLRNLTERLRSHDS